MGLTINGDDSSEIKEKKTVVKREFDCFLKEFNENRCTIRQGKGRFKYSINLKMKVV